MIVRNRAITFGLLIGEGVLVYLCGVLSIYMRFDEDAMLILSEENGWLKLLLAMAVVQSSFYLFDLYDFQMIQQRSVLAVRLVQSLGLTAIVLSLVFYALPQLRLGRGVFLVALMLMLTLMLSWRLLLQWLVVHPRLSEKILILGTEENAIGIAREVLHRRQVGYEVVGFVGDDPQLVGRSLFNPTVVGVMSDLERIVEKHNPDRILVAFTDRRGRLPLELLLKFKVRDEIVIEDSGAFYERLTGKINTDRLRPGQLIFTETMSWMRFYRRLRRLIDIVLSLFGLMIASPVMLLISIAVKLESDGPAFYRQERVGHHGKHFWIIKFRSMRADAEKNGAVWAKQSDPRVTRVGRLIRQTRLDELPQLINILRGEMTLIGPRPERPEFVAQLEQLIPFYAERHLVKPGLTGWAQVCYPYGASIADAREKHQYDLYYIKNQAPLLDAIILLETARVVLFGRLAR